MDFPPSALLLLLIPFDGVGALAGYTDGTATVAVADVGKLDLLLVVGTGARRLGYGLTSGSELWSCSS